MEGDAVGRVHETILHAVFQPEFTGPCQCVCQIIGETFREPCCLGNAVGSHGAGRGRGGVYGEAVHLGTQLVSVKVLEHIAAVGADGVAVGCIGAVVGIGIQLPARMRPSFVTRPLHFPLMAWRVRVPEMVSSRLISSLTGRPPTDMVRNAFKGS